MLFPSIKRLPSGFDVVFSSSDSVMVDGLFDISTIFLSSTRNIFCHVILSIVFKLWVYQLASKIFMEINKN